MKGYTVYSKIQQFRSAGFSQRQVARRLEINRKTVKRYSTPSTPSSQTIRIDGVERGDLNVYNIGGSNFFKLRDLGTALSFDVDFDAASNTVVVRSTQK